MKVRLARVVRVVTATAVVAVLVGIPAVLVGGKGQKPRYRLVERNVTERVLKAQEARAYVEQKLTSDAAFKSTEERSFALAAARGQQVKGDPLVIKRTIKAKFRREAGGAVGWLYDALVLHAQEPWTVVDTGYEAVLWDLEDGDPSTVEFHVWEHEYASGGVISGNVQFSADPAVDQPPVVWDETLEILARGIVRHNPGVLAKMFSNSASIAHAQNPYYYGDVPCSSLSGLQKKILWDAARGCGRNCITSVGSGLAVSWWSGTLGGMLGGGISCGFCVTWGIADGISRMQETCFPRIDGGACEPENGCDPYLY